MIRRGIAALILFGAVAGGGFGLFTWKQATNMAMADFGGGAEPMESVRAALAESRTHQQTTTAIGTVMALRSVTLRNELSGTVKEIHLTPGAIVDAGDLLVALDVSIEEADLKAQRADLAVAETQLARLRRAQKTRAASDMEVDRALAERDVALAQIERTQATITKKTIVAPFPARVGLHDVHQGQYLDIGTELTTLQGVDDEVHVDFRVAQPVASGLKEGDTVAIKAEHDRLLEGHVVALDARVDEKTRNAMVRIRVDGHDVPAPGGSVVVQVPMGAPREAVAIPVNALRRSPGGDYVFVIEADDSGAPRAQSRPVQAGAVDGDDVLILEGLAAGDRVATSGSFKLREGVLVVEADAV